jgi:hypothetical protein
MSVYSSIVGEDIVSKFLTGLEAGRYMIARDGKVWNTEERRDNPALQFDSIWHYINNPPDMHCDWFHDTTTLLNFIPTRCMGCWKLVVRPRTLRELFLLQGLMTEMVADDPTCYCKCGIETRDYVNGNYGGYFYHTSKEIMQDRYKQVRKLVDEQISVNVDVIPKKYCSEFERDFGPSDKYEQPAHAKRDEELMSRTCHMKDITDKQPDIAIKRTMRKWIKHAWSIGDPTVLMYTDGVPLINPVVRYYPEENRQG